MTGNPYIILSSPHEETLAQLVVNHMKQGYVPQGGVSVDRNGKFFQGMLLQNRVLEGEMRLREPGRRK